MLPVPACSSTRPDSVRLSSNDNGWGRVIKHRNDVPQASISHALQRFTVVRGMHLLSVLFPLCFQHMKNHSVFLSAFPNTSATVKLLIFPLALLLRSSLSFGL